ncbi:hypothetical protein J2T12_003946 [Paenibacillus anaericanus]|uniref:DUF4062 domain-containing protein n=1 Tax=Paenibacillus anaericanus TaxID=170367 RepID=UPI00278A6683|nr:DUF4062 domain-containing protein [Paenibacillus anaericanus]MDQ0090523.1 hypothetical protein [Paenibacillus anaericanus]
MKKRLQVFISSTYSDMIEERQAAVTAVLNAGHIPAGMELFKSGDQSQKETIKRWIDESDVYMLILGGRYGSIDEESGKSYTHWEYDYAGETGKRRFAVVIDEEKLIIKGQENIRFIERQNYPKYMDFRSEVLSNMSKFYEDIKDIKLTVMESLKEYENDENLTGWVKSDSLPNVEKILQENSVLLKKNEELRNNISKLKNQINGTDVINGYAYDEIKTILDRIVIVVPENLESKLEAKSSVLEVFLQVRDALAMGVKNNYNKGTETEFIFRKVVPKLMAFGLVEKVKVTGTSYDKIQTSKEGHKFIAKYELERMAELSKT